MSNHRPKAMITRVRLENYKSIKSCDVQLEPLTFLVGPNGSGKSNFLDALSFVSESLRNSLDFALANRGNVSKITHKSQNYRDLSYFQIIIDFKINDLFGYYLIKVNSNPEKFYIKIEEEKLEISKDIFFHVKPNSEIFSSINYPPKKSDTQLYLVKLSGYDGFSDTYSFLSNLMTYNPIPEKIRYPQKINLSNILNKDASNLAFALRSSLKNSYTYANRNDPPLLSSKISEYIAKINFDFDSMNTFNTHILNPEIDNQISFYIGSGGIRLSTREMSDGTLRAFAILVSIFQFMSNQQQISFVGIEEPELALHPAATLVLLDAMREASQETQILVTTHSPDLLDNVDLENGDELVLAVDSRDGQTIIAPIDSASREIVKENLFSLGDLLRMRQLEPEITKPKEQV